MYLDDVFFVIMKRAEGKLVDDGVIPEYSLATTHLFDHKEDALRVKRTILANKRYRGNQLQNPYVNNTIVEDEVDGKVYMTYFVVRANIPTPEIDIDTDIQGGIEEYEEMI